MAFGYTLKQIKTTEFWLLPKPADVSELDNLEATATFSANINIDFQKEETNVEISITMRPTEEYPTELLGIKTNTRFGLHKINNHIDQVLQTLPEELLNSFVSVSINSTRGILLERCRNTYFENVVLPLVNPAEVARVSNESMIWDRVVKLYKEESFEEVNNVINRAIEVYPNYADFYHIKALFLQNIKKMEKESIPFYQKSITLNPNAVNSYYNCGNAYSELQEYKKAIPYYEKAIALNPNAIDAYNNCGTAYGSLKDYKKAISYYEKATDLNPKNAESYNNCGVTYTYLNNYEKALENYQKGLSINPNNASILFNLACLQRLTKDKTTALSYLQKAINLDTKYKNDAQTDTDFEWLWDDADFKKITA